MSNLCFCKSFIFDKQNRKTEENLETHTHKKEIFSYLILLLPRAQDDASVEACKVQRLAQVQRELVRDHRMMQLKSGGVCECVGGSNILISTCQITQSNTHTHTHTHTHTWANSRLFSTPTRLAGDRGSYWSDLRNTRRLKSRYGDSDCGGEEKRLDKTKSFLLFRVFLFCVCPFLRFFFCFFFVVVVVVLTMERESAASSHWRMRSPRYLK